MTFFNVLLVLDLQPFDDGRVVDEVEVSVEVVDVGDALDERHSTLKVGVVGHPNRFGVLENNLKFDAIYALHHSLKNTLASLGLSSQLGSEKSRVRIPL